MDLIPIQVVFWGLVLSSIGLVILYSSLRAFAVVTSQPVRVTRENRIENRNRREEDQDPLVQALSTAINFPRRTISEPSEAAAVGGGGGGGIRNSTTSSPRVRLYTGQETGLFHSQVSRGSSWPTVIEAASTFNTSHRVDSNNQRLYSSESVPLLSEHRLPQDPRMVTPISARLAQSGNNLHSISNINSEPGMSAKKSYTKEQWAARLSETNVSKQVLNNLIMNYLIVEGYQSAAEWFAQEADISSPSNLPASMKGRMEIKSLINNGDIQAAIEKINEMDPELLDVNPSLHFSLLRLQLIELIRQGFKSKEGNIQPALDFATSHLAQRAPSNPRFLQDLEKTMALLCFPPDNLIPQLKSLMDIKLRRRVAQDVNEVLLERQGMVGESKIENLVKLWGWGELQLSLQDVEFPVLDARDFI